MSVVLLQYKNTSWTFMESIRCSSSGLKVGPYDFRDAENADGIADFTV